MTDESADLEPVIEMRLDGELLATSPFPPDVVPDGADSADADASDDAGPGLEVSAETPRETIARLLSEGHKLSTLTILTDGKGTPISVQVQ